MPHVARAARWPILCVAALLLASMASPGATASTWTLPGAAVPTTPAGEALGWALAEVNDGAASLTIAELRSHFADDFLTGLPPDQLLGVFRGYLAPSGPMRLARFEGPTDRPRLRALLATPSGSWRVTLGVQANGGAIDELFFEPVALPAESTPAAKPAKTFAGLAKQLATVAPEVSFVAAEVVDGQCAPVADASLNPDAEFGVGSAFKLYVLGELARQIAAGERHWEDSLAISDDFRSLPSGDLRLQPAGTEFSLRTYAERMIEDSDNTAADHLIGALGRQNVEAMFATMGHADPALNRPLLLTREWFAIKLRFSARQVRRYLAAGEDERRAMLTSTADPDASTLTDVDEWSGPRLIDSIEWFASAMDLCRAMAYLHADAADPALAPVAAALSQNPGLPFDPAVWRYVGYKGGYETGVKSETWLLQRADGRWFAIAAVINDPTKEIDGFRLEQLMVGAARLLGSQG